MKRKSIVVAVDRIEGTTAILETDDGTHYRVPVKSFPEKPSEGLVYRVPLKDRKPEWPGAVADHVETDRRRKQLRKRMNDLRNRDSGGDIEL